MLGSRGSFPSSRYPQAIDDLATVPRILQIVSPSVLCHQDPGVALSRKMVGPSPKLAATYIWCRDDCLTRPQISQQWSRCVRWYLCSSPEMHSGLNFLKKFGR